MSQHLRSIIRVDPDKRNKRLVWFRMETIESSGIVHVLTQWQSGTRAAAARLAKREGLELQESEA